MGVESRGGERGRVGRSRERGRGRGGGVERGERGRGE